MTADVDRGPTAYPPGDVNGTWTAERGRAIEGDLYETLRLDEDVESSPEEDGDESPKMTREDAQSLIGVSISQVATHFTSATTPAVEKDAVLGDWQAGKPLESDEDITPSATPAPPEASGPILEDTAALEAKAPGKNARGFSLGTLPFPNPLELTLPSPWRAGPKQLIVERPEASRSALRAALAPTKRRSISGSGDALRKLLPSMPNVGQFMPSLPSTSFFSSSSTPKSRSKGSLTLNDSKSPFSSSTPISNPHIDDAYTSDRDFSGPGVVPGRSNSQDDVTTTNGADGVGVQQCRRERQPRRVTSHESILYHTTSRASSLGDDTRFENQHEMINSRVKAIRDSLQDRSSFRLPALPSMPNPPSLSDTTAYVLSLGNGFITSKLRTGADEKSGIIPGADKKRPSATPNSAASSSMIGASASRPEVTIENVTQVIDGNTIPLDRAIENLTGDVVIMGGYRGSILRSAKPPHRQLWVPVKVGLNLRKVNLEVGLNPEDEEQMEQHIFSSGMIQNIGPVDVSRRLFKRLRESLNAKNGTLRIWDYGYDWRLSPHLLSRRLTQFLEGLPSNQPGKDGTIEGALVIPHSLGGLITRHVVNKRPELFSGVIYTGVPQACVNILGPIRNGDAVLLSSRVLTAQVNFTLRTTFALLPLEGYCFQDKTTKEPYSVDFFNVDDWIKYRWSPCTDPPLPPKNPSSSGLANILRSSSFTNIQLLPGRKGSISTRRPSQAATSTAPNAASPQLQRPPESASIPSRVVEGIEDATTKDGGFNPQMGNRTNPVSRGQSINSSISTTVTIPRKDAIAYLRRTLAEVKQFKIELAHNEALESTNQYPPLAVIYGKSIPTVYGAKVDGRDSIACADVYDDLAFASGDGVCLAREAMLPEGYRCVQGGRISSDRGHLSLLGDLNAVGRAIEAVRKGRARGLGLGLNEIAKSAMEQEKEVPA
ncbi:MAG: hypothetical protein M1818_004662 [Claussenomyces sp. TS43310]|nr:MAG: hypothetical protein M1818_004662 [Claussenomyces sp. TS43310]